MNSLQQQKAINQQLIEIQAENEIMRKIATPSGFFDYYFECLALKKKGLPVYRNMVECFNHVNDTYFELFGEYKYSDYGSFKQIIYRNHKK